MKKLLVGMMLSLLAFPAAGQQWELVWSDEFEIDGLPDPVRWSYDVGDGCDIGLCGWGNQELQFYTEARLENVRVEDGILTIEARREAFQGSQYTSARIVTRDKAEWTYGRYEIRAKLPSGRGSWTGIWLLHATSRYGNGTWPDNGEIDIMEHVGFEPDRIHASLHNEVFNGQKGNDPVSTWVDEDVETEFHTYTLEWTPRQITAHIDDRQHFIYENQGLGWPTWPYDQPFYLILNIAVGGTWGGQRGIDDSTFPQQLEVDYVRVYRNAAVPEVSLESFDISGNVITLEAEASDADGSIERVELLQGEGVVAALTEAPYTFEIPDAALGCYVFSVRATDDQGWQSTTDPVAFPIQEDCPQAPFLVAPAAIPGTIEAEYYDLGGQNIAYRDLDPTNSGRGIRQDEGVDTEPTRDVGGGDNVTGIASREWIHYTMDVETAGRYRVEARVASAGTGAFTLEFDGEDKTGEIGFSGTGGQQTWQTITHEDVFLDSGVQTMRLDVDDGGFNLNWLTFTLLEATAAEEDYDVPEQALTLDHFPNPLHHRATIVFHLPRPGLATLEVFDVLGRRVATLAHGRRAAGRHEVSFDAGNLPGGVYVYRLRTPDGTRVCALTRLP